MTRRATTIFLGFEAGFLDRVACRLLLRPRDELAECVVVLPGRRAARALLERLIDSSDGAIEPPRIVTEAGLAQAFARDEWELASPVLVEAAWHDALATATPESLACFSPRPWKDLDVAARWSLARDLAALDRDWAADIDANRPPGGPREAARRQWAAAVGKTLGARRRGDPARPFDGLGDSRSRRSARAVILVGIGEVSLALRGFLSDLDSPTEAWCHADEDCAAGFDAWGGLIASFWERRAVPDVSSVWSVADGPSAAAADARAWLAALPAGTRDCEVVVGLLAEALGVGLADHLAAGGLGLHLPQGRSLRASAPWLALDALRAWIRRGDFASLAAAMRHPAIAEVVSRGVDDSADALPAQLDAWHRDHLPDRLRGSAAVDAAEFASVARACAGLDEICAEFLSTGNRPPGAWASPLTALICRLFPSSTDVDAGGDAGRDAQALAALAETVRGMRELGSDVGGECAGGDALALCLEWSGRGALIDDAPPGALEAVGWLDLAFEDAPHRWIVGLNEGWVPRRERANPFEGGIGADAVSVGRAKLRYARDVLAWTAILRSSEARGRSLRVLSLRRGVDDLPLRPSRLLFHGDPSASIERARCFFQTIDAEVAPDRRGNGSDHSGKGGRSWSPAVPSIATPTSIAVSAFKAYLTSPYLYFLERALRLENSRDDASELDVADFGSIAHAVLERFGSNGPRDSTDPDEIATYLRRELTELAGRRFPTPPLPAVQLQLGQLLRRLERFARVQAEEAQQGWRIAEVEVELNGATLNVGGRDFRIHGRVDRIDRHADGRRWRILDYKTGDSSQDPLKAHLSAERWVDLQLPLYRHFLRARLAGEIELGYFALPHDLTKVRVAMADFTPEQLEQALDAARAVLAAISEGKFADVGQAKPRDRVRRTLCGLSLLDAVGAADGSESSDADGEAGGGE